MQEDQVINVIKLTSRKRLTLKPPGDGVYDINPVEKPSDH